MERGRLGYIIRTSACILIGLVRIGASLAFVWTSKLLVDIATGVSDRNLKTFILLMVGIMLLQIICEISVTCLKRINIIKTTNTLQKSTFEKVLRSRWAGREVFSSGDITSRLQEDIRIITDMLSSRIPEIILTVCQLVAASIYLLSLAPNLVWLLIALMVIAVVGSKMFFKIFRKLTDHIRKTEAAVQQHIQENTLNRILVLTLFGVDKVVSKLETLQDDILKTSVNRLRYSASAWSFMYLGFRGGYAITFFWGIFGIMNGTVSYGMMTAFLQLVGQIQRPVADLSSHIPELIKSLTSYSRLKELFSLPQEDKEEKIILESAPAIVADSISFSYGNFKILDNFSFTFPSGKITAIMGPTGRGKSTLVRIIMSILSPEEGHIFLETDKNGRFQSTVALRCNFMYVPQGNSLISGSIRENMMLAANECSDDDIREALHVAAADFVYDLPDGLDTICGESGTGLSEGQSQRIAIARALLHPGCVLVLDEATSALDSYTEQLFLERLMTKYRGKKTILFVSHRDTVSSLADAVLTL